jgi:transposase-like protein
MALTGPDGLHKALTNTVVEIAFNEEMSDHLGYDSMPWRVATGRTPRPGNGPRRS